VFEPDGSASTDFYICAIEMKHSPLLKEGVQADQVGFESKRSPSAVSGGVLVSPLPMGGAYRLVATSNDRIAESADFTVDAPTPLPQITLKFLEGKTVTASVTDPDGHPRGGVQITMEFDAPSHHSFGIMQKPTRPKWRGQLGPHQPGRGWFIFVQRASGRRLLDHLHGAVRVR